MTTTTPTTNPPTWARKWLIAAGIYNLVWGAIVIAFPNLLFNISNMEPPLYPQIWQCVGMIVGVYGIGYLAAASNSRVHWPIVLVGLLGKIFGPLGFAYALINRDLPPTFGITILTNDLIWWVPFSMMLWDAAKSRHQFTGDAPSLDQALDTLTDQHGTTLRQLSNTKPTLLVLVRHSGCTFCKETLADLKAQRQAIEASGHAIAIVSMSDPQSLENVTSNYDLSDCALISDPNRTAYRALGLNRGTFTQLLGPAVWLRGFAATIRGNLVGKLDGDGFQMPGSFIIHSGKITKAFRHKHAAERLDHDQFCSQSCTVPA